MPDSIAGCASAATRSRLGKSLIRLHRSLDVAGREEDLAEDVFDTFRRRWWRSRRRIGNRLQMIQAQLDVMDVEETVSVPRLAVIADSIRGDDSPSRAAS